MPLYSQPPQSGEWQLGSFLSFNFAHLQVELGPQGIDCVSLWPGVVYTEFVQSLPLGRTCGPVEPVEVEDDKALEMEHTLWLCQK